MRWTNEQQLAIEREGNLIVSAAAGAGKTAVLTERIVSRIRAGAPVDSLLVLTFTNAAASEMKGRIAKRLNTLADEAADEGEKRYLRRQARGVDGAYISTVHSFCARVIKRHYHVLGLPARARTADEMESAALIEAVQDDLLTELAAAEDADYRTLLAAFGGERQAWDAVLDAYRFTRAEPEPERWLDAAAARYENESAVHDILNDAVVFCKGELRLVIETVQRERDLLSPEWAGVIGILDDELARYRGMLLNKRYDQYREALLQMEYARMNFPRGTSEEEKAPVQAARKMGKALIDEQKKRLIRPEQDALDILCRSGAVVTALCAIVRRFEAAFSAEKRNKNLVDYDDLEHFALAALGREEIAREYREQFRWIAVDEYQDSNRVQEAIIGRIARVDNLFFVGDVKQSIYRFRQAEPALFLQKLTLFDQSAGRIDLASNFRSSREVLSAVNETFETILTEESGGIDYDGRARLVCGAETPDGGAELHLIRKERTGLEEEDALEDAADMEVEALLIAQRIREIMRQETFTEATGREPRRYRYSDFAVLLRAGTDAQTLTTTLASCGVPAYALSSGGYFDALEVQILLNLLSVIDNRRQDVPLISVLCSSIGGFTCGELARIRAAHKSGPFYEAFFACSDLLEPDALSLRARAFLERLTRYRAESRLITVEELIGRLLDETGFYEEMGAGMGGEQRQANLNALLEKAHTFEDAGSRGIWGFLRYLALAEKRARIGSAQTVSADVVRVLTIHKSKGLEFPVVFVAGLGKKFNDEDLKKNLQMHASFGMALRFIDRVGTQRLRRDTLYRVVLSQRVRREQRAEEMRILYVAMTRAKRKLILTACLNKPQEALATAPRTPTAWQVLRSPNPARWLIMGSRRQLAVSVEERFGAPGGDAAKPDRELPPYDPAVLDKIETLLSWQYAHAEAARVAAKAAVSRVVRGEDRPPEFRKPAFLGGESGAVFAGTATHAAMQFLPLGKPMDAAMVSAYLTALAQSGRIEPEQAAAADADAIAWFTGEPLFYRMSAAERAERELPFSYPVDAELLYGIAADERVLLQGVLDACFLEDGAWTVIDYKTDRVRPGESAEEAAGRHREQLRLYALALEALTGKPVREAYVVLLSHRAAVRVLSSAAN